jgi:hypothetical protein
VRITGLEHPPSTLTPSKRWKTGTIGMPRRRVEPDQKPKVGRPSEYTEEIASLICERMADGESLLQIMKTPGMPDRRTVYRWLTQYSEFRHNYAQARESLEEHWADQIITIPEDTDADSDHVQLARLKVDSRKWVLARTNKKYQDKVSQEHTGKDGAPLIPPTATLKLSIGESGTESSSAYEAGEGLPDAGE